MKKTAIFCVIFYQGVLSVFLKQLLGQNAICRFTPSCSEYTKLCLSKYGFVKGIKMGLIRIFHCQPLSNNHASI